MAKERELNYLAQPVLIRKALSSRRDWRSEIAKFPRIEATHDEQVEADKLCSQMRRDCEDLLRNHGKLRKSWWRELGILMEKVTLAGIASPIRRSGVTVRELWESRFLETEVNVEGGKPVKIQLTSMGTVDPLQASRIIIEIPEISGGTRGWLMLLKDHGELWMRDMGIRLPTEKPVRRANLVDAQEFGQVVDFLKQQFPS